MIANIRIFNHQNLKSVDVYEFNVVTVVNGVVSCDLFHAETLYHVGAPVLHKEHIGKHYHPDLYPDTTVEKWFDHELE